jgi:hypothetical protein
MVVAAHTPEIEGGRTEGASHLRRFTDRISALTFDAHHARPVGMTASIALSLQLAHALESGEMTLEEMADLAAADITRGADSAWSDRTRPVTPRDVLDAPRVTSSLTQLMMPAECTGVIAIVLASPTRIARARQVRAWLTGWAVTSSDHLASASWLTEPLRHSGAAAEKAYQQAGLASIDDADVIELTGLTPALLPHAARAVGLSDHRDERINRSGGALSSFPGVANGALRMVKAIESLDQLASGSRPSRAVVHSTDNLMGPVSASSSVIVLERR